MILLPVVLVASGNLILLGLPLLLATEISERGRNLVADRELSKVTARLDLMAAQADEKYRRAALDFGQNWILGSLGPFFAMAKP